MAADSLKVKFVDSGTSGPEWEGKSYIKHYITLRTDRQTDAGRGAVTLKDFCLTKEDKEQRRRECNWDSAAILRGSCVDSTSALQC